MDVPEPITLPLCRPFNIGPPDTTIVGKSVLHAPIKHAGVVLSHPTNKTIPSTGLALPISSTSIAHRFRYIIAVGLKQHSPVANTEKRKMNPMMSDTINFSKQMRTKHELFHTMTIYLALPSGNHRLLVSHF
mmetsp:Transcript_25654/g.46307  ORF Transcript_25654/g.46307 Transcript_25654/m.46307 type:complete len:132 (-) Transcript_25654:669-1064(-)